jgi:NADPH-dependent curcumin reductase CurA
VAAGDIKLKETVVDGFENLPAAFIGLFSGDNTGKMVVRLAPPAPVKSRL